MPTRRDIHFDSSRPYGPLQGDDWCEHGNKWVQFHSKTSSGYEFCMQLSAEQIHGIATRVPSAQTNTLKKILKAEHRLLRVCLLVTLNEENSRKEKRVPAAGASSGGGGRSMRQPTLMTGSKLPFGSL